MPRRNANLGLITAPVIAGCRKLIDTPLVINGTEVTPSVQLLGVDASASGWTCRSTGRTLAQTGSGPTYDLDGPALTDNAVGGGASHYLTQATWPEVTLAELDGCWEAVLFIPESGSSLPYASSNESNPRWYIYMSVTGVLNLFIHDGSGYKQVSNGVGGTLAGQWIHFFAGWNEDENSTNGFHSYTNVTLCAAPQNPYTIGSVGGARLNVLQAAAGCKLALLHFWKGSDLWSAGATGAAEMAALAKERYALWIGDTALHNHETLIPEVSGSRTTPAYGERVIDYGTGEKQLFYHGANGLRLDVIKDPHTGLWLPGHRREPERSQLVKTNRDLDSWSISQASVPTTDYEAPDGSLTADVIHENATAAVQHGIYNSHTASSTLGVGYEYSTYVKMLNRRYMTITAFSVSESTPKYTDYGFDLQQKVGIPAVSYPARDGDEAYLIDDLGNGWLRIGFNKVAEVTALYYTLIFTANESGGLVYNFHQGLDQDSFALWLPQTEAGKYASSPIINDGAGMVTRTADAAGVKVLGAEMAWMEWTLLVPVIVPGHTPGSNLKLISVYKDGAAGTDHVSLWADTSKQALVTSAASGKSAGSATAAGSDICDGGLHWLSIHAKDGQVYCWVDSMFVGIDHDAGIAPDLDRVSIEPSGAWVGGIIMLPRCKRLQPRPGRYQRQLIAA